jgi:hypothetical protein
MMTGRSCGILLKDRSRGSGGESRCSCYVHAGCYHLLMPGRPPGDRSLILACSVRSLRQFVLDAQCVSGRCVHYPLELLAAGRLAGMTIATVVVQLRCKDCGQRPAINTAALSSAATWRGYSIPVPSRRKTPPTCSDAPHVPPCVVTAPYRLSGTFRSIGASSHVAAALHSCFAG